MSDNQLVLDQIFDELMSRRDDQGFTFVDEKDLDRWTKELAKPWQTALNLIGIELAKRYHAGEVSYEFGDGLANDLWAEVVERMATKPTKKWPEKFDEVYSAFDAGEWLRKEDGDADPVKLYTDPAIAEIVAKYS